MTDVHDISAHAFSDGPGGNIVDYSSSVDEGLFRDLTD